MPNWGHWLTYPTCPPHRRLNLLTSATVNLKREEGKYQIWLRSYQFCEKLSRKETQISKSHAGRAVHPAQAQLAARSVPTVSCSMVCHREQKDLRELGHKQSLISTAIYRTTYSLKWKEMLVTAEVVLDLIQSIKVIHSKNTRPQVILELVHPFLQADPGFQVEAYYTQKTEPTPRWKLHQLICPHISR